MPLAAAAPSSTESSRFRESVSRTYLSFRYSRSSMASTKSSSSVCADSLAHTGTISVWDASEAEASDIVERKSGGNEHLSIRHKKTEHYYHPVSLPTPPNSPQPLPCMVEENVNSEEIEYAGEVIPDGEEWGSTGSTLDMQELKFDLALDEMQCRSPTTTKGKPCGRYIPSNEYIEVSKLLHALGQQGLLLEQLVGLLESLVSQVHCFQHRAGFGKESRLDTWISFIARPHGLPKPVLLVSRDITRALNLSTRCIGLTQKKTHCKGATGGQRVHNCRRTLERLIDPEVYRSELFVDTFLEIMEANRYCKYHTKQHQPGLQRSWKLAIGVACEKPFFTNETSEHLHIDRLGLSLKNHDCDSAYATTDSRSMRTLSSPTMTFGASIDAATFWPEAMDISPWTSIKRRHQMGPTMQGSSIASVAREPLDKEDQKMGQVYIYRVRGQPKLLKIGYTRRSVAKRHQEWESDCNREVLSIYPLEPSATNRLENARRVEALCHAELDDCRVWIYCENCMKTHDEWFDVLEDRAVSIVKKWSSWMATKPYHGNCLKEERRKELARKDGKCRRKAGHLESS